MSKPGQFQLWQREHTVQHSETNESTGTFWGKLGHMATLVKRRQSRQLLTDDLLGVGKFTPFVCPGVWFISIDRFTPRVISGLGVLINLVISYVFFSSLIHCNLTFLTQKGLPNSHWQNPRDMALLQEQGLRGCHSSLCLQSLLLSVYLTSICCPHLIEHFFCFSSQRWEAGYW